MSNNKETKKFIFTYNIAIFISIILAALKLDGHLDIPWIVVIVPIIIDVALGLVITFVIMLWLGIMKIRESIKENSYGKHLYNKRTFGNPIYWDYKSQSFYDVAGNRIDNTIEDEEEQD